MKKFGIFVLCLMMVVGFHSMAFAKTEVDPKSRTISS
jgi:hypothetical protein